MTEAKCLICKEPCKEFFCKECAKPLDFLTFDEYLEDIVSKMERVAYE